ncbi:patatin-like phospholipase family protein [Sinimarinibacterium sp. NLF-5-8]|uniref:patatin-like phospholipase family protein n=1 Tax=Sinimarinibacterium sp. NLF-5-8 TaxID=2698684 RepID=UPI00137BD758|nr:patatin-like phospholipase family protein [Sinimarinibacterium sp. NLF-5-8]QHS10873.1 cyclic nucleotide-binding domain-containing protein [Sinimarinibacterium sp. NLF-5-8]
MDARSVLAECPLFVGLSAAALDALAARAEMLEVPSGHTVVNRGARPESIYIVATGRLCAVLPDNSIAGLIGRLEPVGEIGTLSGEPHMASVHAVRDSVLVRLPGAHLYAVIEQYPEALLAMTQVIIRRLRHNRTLRRSQQQQQSRSFAVVVGSPGADALMVANHLCAALAPMKKVRLLTAESVDADLGEGVCRTPGDSSSVNQRLITYLNQIETENGYLVYVAEAADPWARRSMRQADRILFVVDADSPPMASKMLEQLRECSTRAPIELVVIRADGMDAPAMLTWRERTNARAHYYVRRDNVVDFTSLARQLTERGIGLVLGGGGARGFAHIGLLRALEELQIPVDLVGGSSMGAFFSALVACGKKHGEILDIARRTFVQQNLLNDFLFPTVALIRGRKFLRHLQQVVFGEQQIEALRMPFFCVSTNLTRGGISVHDQGPLALWVATSMAVPGVVPPVVFRGELLCDGAVANSLPTDVMYAMERGPIIASDVSTEGGIAAPGIEGPDPEGLLHMRGGGERPRLFSIMFRTATLTSESGTARRAEHADAYLRMPIEGVGLFDWKKLDEVVERGYRHALERLTPIRDQLCAPEGAQPRS